MVSAGSPDVRVTASGISPIAFGDFEFVRLQEGVHGGYFQIDGMPISIVPATAQARVPDAVREATFRVVDERGTSLGSAPLERGLPHTGTDDYIGTFDLPAVPFQVVMNGLDASGAPVQRQHGLTYRAQPVALFFHYDRSNVIEPGTSRRITFSVTNVASERATFALESPAVPVKCAISRREPLRSSRGRPRRRPSRCRSRPTRNTSGGSNCA